MPHSKERYKSMGLDSCVQEDAVKEIEMLVCDCDESK